MLDNNHYADKKEALKSLIKVNEEIKKQKRKRMIIIVISILVILLFKIFIKEIDITMPNVQSLNNNRLYQVSLNSEKIFVGVEEVEKKAIVPFVLYLKYNSSHSFLGKENLKYNLGDNINLNIKSFECFADNIQLSCIQNKNNLVKKEVFDTKYKLYIKQNKKGEKVMYDGKFTNDIGKYFPEKGNYYVSIVAEYKNVISNVYFYLKIE